MAVILEQMAPTMTPAPSSEEGRPLLLGRVPWLRLTAEFGVIFLGITLSLLADDWRQARSEAETERRALEELSSDLVADDSVLTSLQRQTESHNVAMMWLYQHRGDARVDPDSANAGLGSAHIFDPPHFLRATYAGLMSTGRLRVIRSDDLRREIVTYYENVVPEVSRFHDIYYDVWYSFRELVGPDYVWLYEEDAEGFGSGAGLGGELERPWSEVSGDPTLVFRLREAGVVAAVVSQLASRALAENAELRMAIHGHLGM